MTDLLLKTIENDFRSAIERLQNGKPNNRELKKRQSAGTLKINFSTVALEAKRARALIALKEDCRLPSVRNLVLEIMGGRTSEVRTYTELIHKLRVEKTELMVQVRLYQAEAAKQFLGRKSVEKRCAELERQLANALKQLAQQGKIVALVPTSSNDTDE